MNIDMTKKIRTQPTANTVRKGMLRNNKDSHKYSYKECRENIIRIVKNNKVNTGKAEHLIVEELQKFRKSEFQEKISKEIYKIQMGFYDIPGFKKIGMHIGHGNWHVEFETEYGLITRHTMIL